VGFNRAQAFPAYENALRTVGGPHMRILPVLFDHRIINEMDVKIFTFPYQLI
jgi:hypothetical protein